MANASLYAYWPLGESGVDLSGRGKHGTFYGSSATKQRGPFGNKGSRLFSGGTNDYVDFGNNVGFADKGTVSFWIKWVNRQSGGDASYQHNLISKRDGAGTITGSIGVYFNDNRAATECFTLSFRDSTTNWAKRSPALNGLLADDVWYHVALVYDLKTTGNTHYYLNGRRLQGGLQIDGVTTETWVETPTTASRIGYSANFGASVNAYVSEVAFINARLQDEQILDYYNSCVGHKTTARIPVTTIEVPSSDISETAYAADAVTASLSTFWPVAAETAIAEDTVEARNTYHHPAASELAEASDSVIAYLLTKNVSLTETGFASDTLEYRVSSHWAVVDETAVAADAVDKSVTVDKTINEVAEAADDVFGVIPKWLEIDEAATASDELTFEHIYISTPKYGTYKLSLTGYIRTTLFLKYQQKYNCAEKVFCPSARQNYTVWETVWQRYAQGYGLEMTHVPISYRQTYDLVTTAIFRKNWSGGLQAFTYNIREPFVFSSRQFNDINERTRVDLRQRVFYTVRENDDYTENVSYNYRVMLDGLDFTDKVKSLSYNYSLEQYTGECSITWADPQMYAQLDPLSSMGTVRIEVYTGHYGFPLTLQGRFLIEKRSTEIDASKAYPTTWGRTITARLASPHSLPITKTWMYDTKALSIALEVMQLSDPAIQLNWQVTDYDVLGGNFVAAGDEPITLLTKLAEPLGAIVTTNKQGQIVVRYRYV